jgi:AcrR family transcriptional regulator
MSSSLGAQSTRSPYHHGNLRFALLAAARDLSQEQGTDSVTLRETARRAGVSHAAAYHHFADKRDLLRSLAAEATADLATAMSRTLASDQPFAETLEKIAITYIEFARDRQAEFRFMFSRELCMPSGEPDALRDAQLRMQDAFENYFRAHGNLIQDADPRTLTLTLWSLIHGLATILVETPALKDLPAEGADELARQTVRVLVRGLAV